MFIQLAIDTLAQMPPVALILLSSLGTFALCYAALILIPEEQ
jgi:hypothetical protein